MKQLLKMVISTLGWLAIAKYLLIGILSGLTNFLFINSVTRIVNFINVGEYTSISKEYIVIFGTIILVVVLCKKYLATYSVFVAQRYSWNLRKEIIALALKANYEQLRKIKPRIQVTLFSDVGALTAASMSVIDFLTSMILTISCLIYLASISVYLFLITIGVAGIGMIVFSIVSKINLRAFNKSRDLENRFHKDFNSIVDGFKEIFLEPKKGKYIYEERVSVTADQSFKHNINALTGLINSQMTGQILFYVLISSVLLVFSVVLKIKPPDIVSCVFTLTFLLGSIETAMVLFPALLKASVAAKRLLDLKQELAEQTFASSNVVTCALGKHFRQLAISNLAYSYTNDGKSFSIGPISLQIQAGETIFIYGSNGSGKTTLINSITGMFLPSMGSIELNSILISVENYPDYRSFFSVVFSDFYLFDKIIGIDVINITLLNFYLELFEMNKIVTVHEGAYSTTDLSTGQRKRLALIAALLEEKPILVLDEWAADQDPNFRKKFYSQIIPIIKKQGVSIIAITHDDHYYHCADRLFMMDDGRLQEKEINQTINSY